MEYNMDTEIKNLENQIESLEKMIDALTGNNSKQVTILANKIKSGLQIEYTDFQDALEIPMTIELGENLREQLKNIFRVLKKLGIEFE